MKGWGEVIKAMFFDLDGTLLTSDKRVSASSQKALQECRLRGVRLFVATARPPLLERMLPQAWEYLSGFDGGCYYNGGCVAYKGEKRYTFADEGVIREIWALAQRHSDINFALQLENETHMIRFQLSLDGYKSWGVAREDVAEIGEGGFSKTAKAMIFYDSLIDKTRMLSPEIVREIAEICESRALLYITDGGRLAQIMSRGASKLNGVRDICGLYGIAEDEAAVFGDDLNDLELIKAFKNSVAMGNAVDMVKEHAAFVTKANDDDGIAHAISFLLK